MSASLQRRRSEAAERFRALGVPHRRVEEWKYSDLKAALTNPIGEDDVSAWTLDEPPRGVEVVDVAQTFDAAPDWVERNFGRLSAQDAMSSASLAFATPGLAMRVGEAVDGPILLEHRGGGHGRALLVVEAGVQATLIERNADTPGQVSNLGAEIVLEEGAKLVHVLISARHEDVSVASAVMVHEISVAVARDAEYRAHIFTDGAALSRLEFAIGLEGKNAQAHLSGVGVLRDGAHADITTHVVHAVGDTQSTQLFKYVAGGKSRAVYQGRITVAEGADGSDSRQTAKALLLSERAEADLKPELEIFADDVKCAHGAAVGDLDADSLFYLRARGVPEGEARGLLIHAFLDDAFAGIEDDEIREAMLTAVEAALPHAQEDRP
jgi:Fe-S cluster assembly protein SufD